MPASQKPLTVAYFSLEFMLESDIPTYAGGLGVLAGDLMHSCADMEVAAVGVSLVYDGNTFSQIINPDGTQTFQETDWQKLDQLTKLPNRVEIIIKQTKVLVDCWRFDMVGKSGFVVPIYLLDTDIPENEEWVRGITKNLYGGDGAVRISQEILLGFGGVAMLRNLGYTEIKTYHLNEGHCAFVPLALESEFDFDDEKVRQKCAFTTHTPVPEGHDRFDYNLAYQYAGDYLPWHIKKIATENNLSMTDIAYNLSKKSFAVSKKHRQVSKNIFPGFKFDSITNGVYHLNWTHPFMQDLFQEFLPGWGEDPRILKNASSIPSDKLWQTHQACKQDLINYVNKHLTSITSQNEKDNPKPEELFDLDTLTISLARRPVPYKRPLLLYSDIKRLIDLGAGKIQIIQCGKAHPDDGTARGFVQEIINYSKKLRFILRICYLENYSPKIARSLVSGSDIWLNTPRRPQEASGTSGMKAALNGILNFSILDGWWIEGYQINPLAGFAIGPEDDSLSPNNDDGADANDLYTKLEQEIIPSYYEKREEWVNRMKASISLGSYFNTNRCIKEYLDKAWDVKMATDALDLPQP